MKLICLNSAYAMSLTNSHRAATALGGDPLIINCIRKDSGL